MSKQNFNQDQLRDVFGQFATGVCIITSQSDKYDALGITVNSFSSVSLDPPLLLWSLSSDNEYFNAFYNADTFTVNILNSEQEALSSRHANPKTNTLISGCFHIGNTGAPVLNECLSSIECELKERISGGDHTIILGEVKVVKIQTGKPLLFLTAIIIILQNE